MCICHRGQKKSTVQYSATTRFPYIVVLILTFGCQLTQYYNSITAIYILLHGTALASFPDLPASFGTRSEAEGLVSQVT